MVLGVFPRVRLLLLHQVKVQFSPHGVYNLASFGVFRINQELYGECVSYWSCYEGDRKKGVRISGVSIAVRDFKVLLAPVNFPRFPAPGGLGH